MDFLATVFILQYKTDICGNASVVGWRPQAAPAQVSFLFLIMARITVTTPSTWLCSATVSCFCEVPSHQFAFHDSTSMEAALWLPLSSLLLSILSREPSLQLEMVLWLFPLCLVNQGESMSTTPESWWKPGNLQPQLTGCNPHILQQGASALCKWDYGRGQKPSGFKPLLKFPLVTTMWPTPF